MGAEVTFKPGDIVKCVEENTVWGLYGGHEYTVDHIQDQHWVHVRDQFGVTTGGWDPDRFIFLGHAVEVSPWSNIVTVSDTTDSVNHPHHYARWPMEPIEFIAINNLPWWLANLLKYAMRYDAKDGLKDLYKARSYLDMKIREQEGVEKFWEKPVNEERKLNAA